MGLGGLEWRDDHDEMDLSVITSANMKLHEPISDHFGFSMFPNKMIPARGPQTTVYTEIKNPSNVSVVWGIILNQPQRSLFSNSLKDSM